MLHVTWRIVHFPGLKFDPWCVHGFGLAEFKIMHNDLRMTYVSFKFNRGFRVPHYPVENIELFVMVLPGAYPLGLDLKPGLKLLFGTR